MGYGIIAVGKFAPYSTTRCTSVMGMHGSAEATMRRVGRLCFPEEKLIQLAYKDIFPIKREVKITILCEIVNI
jgi:hypothetical protein